MDIQSLRTDLNAAEDGIDFPFGEDCTIKIAQWHNKKHLSCLRKIHKVHGRRIDAGAVPDDEANHLLAAQWEHIVTGWSGLMDGKTVLKYSPKTVIDLAQNPQYKGFFEQIGTLSKAEENYRMEALAEMGEMSPTT